MLRRASLTVLYRKCPTANVRSLGRVHCGLQIGRVAGAVQSWHGLAPVRPDPLDPVIIECIF